MPTYEFACPSGHRFDKFFRKISDSTSTLPCPECGAEATRQLSGGAGLIFKGSGFYITDYGKDGKKSTAAPAKSGDAGQGDSSKPAPAKGDSSTSGGTTGGTSSDAASKGSGSAGGSSGSSSGE